MKLKKCPQCDIKPYKLGWPDAWRCPVCKTVLVKVKT